MVVGFGGAVVMALPALGGSNSAFGVGLILAALVSYGVALNVARPLQMRNGAVPVMWRALGVALLLTAPLGLPEVLDARWALRPALAMLCLGAGGTAIANVLTATAAGRMGATTASATSSNRSARLNAATTVGVCHQAQTGGAECAITAIV